MSELLAEVIYPEHLKKVLLSKARQKKYYELGSSLSKKMAKKYHNKEAYEWRCVNKRSFLYHIGTDDKVVANPKAAGTPKYQIINGQAIYNGAMHPTVRAKVFRELKEHIAPYLDGIEPIKEAPLKIFIEIHDTIREGSSLFDIDNRSYPYLKAWQDVLTGNKGENKVILQDDNILIVTTVQSKFIPVHTTAERQIIFKIYKEDDPRIIEFEAFIKELDIFRNGK